MTQERLACVLLARGSMRGSRDVDAAVEAMEIGCRGEIVTGINGGR